VFAFEAYLCSALYVELWGHIVDALQTQSLLYDCESCHGVRLLWGFRLLHTMKEEVFVKRIVSTMLNSLRAAEERSQSSVWRLWMCTLRGPLLLQLCCICSGLTESSMRTIKTAVQCDKATCTFGWEVKYAERVHFNWSGLSPSTITHICK
jgi:hypothetical protein